MAADTTKHDTARCSLILPKARTATDQKSGPSYRRALANSYRVDLNLIGLTYGKDSLASRSIPAGNTGS